MLPSSYQTTQPREKKLPEREVRGRERRNSPQEGERERERRRGATMSTSKAVCADNFWMPDGTKWSEREDGRKGRNSKDGKVRFELPFDARCARCGASQAKGTRTNAIKRVVEERWTWEFHVRNTCCNAQAVVRADVRSGTYRAVQGLVERCRNDADGTTTSTGVEQTAKNNAMRDIEQRMECKGVDASMAREDERKDAAMAKTRLRMARRKQQRCQREAMRLGIATHVNLLPKRSEDEREATRVMRCEEVDRRDRNQRKRAMRDVLEASIFPSANVPCPRRVKKRGT